MIYDKEAYYTLHLKNKTEDQMLLFLCEPAITSKLGDEVVQEFRDKWYEENLPQVITPVVPAVKVTTFGNKKKK